MLLQIFNEETSGNNHMRGQIVLNNDLISTLDITTDEDLLSIDGNIISENLFNEYNTRIVLDINLFFNNFHNMLGIGSIDSFLHII